ncbi:MAG TPA: penicillin-binding protein 2 [Thermoflexia bacterium]|nr:penicillin-binding protein 2 [Thermoflexia bacterium]
MPAPLPAQRTGYSRPSWIQRSPRVAFFGWLILLVVGFYVVRLWQLQFLEQGFYLSEAEGQLSRLIFIPPRRGVIYDRQGELLVRNIPAYNVTITPGYLPEDAERERAVLQRLSRLIDVPYSSQEEVEPYRLELGTVGRAHFPPYGEYPPPGLLERVNEVRYLDPYAPLIVAETIDRELAMVIAQEGGLTLPGIDVQIIPRRSYTTGPLTAQVIGFLGKIPPDMVEELQAQGYNPNVERIGYAGIEYEVEENLRGVPGHKYVRKDFLGKELGVIGEVIEPIMGDNVHLTLDTELQQVADEALRAEMAQVGCQRGVVIAMDPRDGQILALVSLPTFDNNFFAEGINSTEDLEELQALNDDVHGPLFNHAIADRVPPGSVFKIIPATAALQEGLINRHTIVNCPGRISLPNKLAPNDPGAAQPFYCWINLLTGGGHGPTDVVDALAQSCDVFFYEIGGGFPDSQLEGLGVKRLAAWAEKFGLGAPTGIDIPGEWQYDVSVPDDKWKREVYQESWTTGDTYNMSIGQGFLAFSPLQMVNALVAVANGGTLYQPQVIHHITDAEGNVIQEFQPQVIRELAVDDAVWAIVHEGLERAVTDGTSTGAQIEGVRVAGKTGTAEYCDNLAQEADLCPVPAGQTLPTHAWFMAYAPAEAPEIAVVAWVYNGGEGSEVSVPITHAVLDFYFKRAAGELPVAGEEVPAVENSGE